MTEVDPLTKVAVMLAIRALARREGAHEPLDALAWALNRGIVVARPGTDFMDAGKVDDLILTEHGRGIVVAFWRERERRRMMRQTRRAA